MPGTFNGKTLVISATPTAGAKIEMCIRDRAKEDYLMGINFSRVLTLRYGNSVSNYLNTKYQAISVGRVMTCILGMVVRREREIRAFVKTPFYRVLSSIALEGENFEGEWRACLLYTSMYKKDRCTQYKDTWIKMSAKG